MKFLGLLPPSTPTGGIPACDLFTYFAGTTTDVVKAILIMRAMKTSYTMSELNRLSQKWPKLLS